MNGPAPPHANGASALGGEGLRQIVSAGLVSYERLPMLEVVFDRLIRILSTNMRGLTSDTIEVSLDEIVSVRFGDYMRAVPTPALLFVFRAEQWDSLGLLAIDGPMVLSIVDVLLGGRQSGGVVPTEGRSFTTIERTLIEDVARNILQDLATSFDPVCPITFRHERTETDPRFAAISRSANAAMVAKLRLKIDNRGGCFDVVLPYATLEPVRDLLLQQFMGERFGHDSVWETHLADELRQTTVELEAILGEERMHLAEMLALQVGSRIVFSLGSDDPVELRCGGVSLFLARTGNRRDRIAVQIEDRVSAQIETRGETT